MIFFHPTHVRAYVYTYVSAGRAAQLCASAPSAHPSASQAHPRQTAGELCGFCARWAPEAQAGEALSNDTRRGAKWRSAHQTGISSQWHQKGRKRAVKRANGAQVVQWAHGRKKGKRKAPAGALAIIPSRLRGAYLSNGPPSSQPAHHTQGEGLLGQHALRSFLRSRAHRQR